MARSTPEVNGGSLADIAFLLLIFFLVTTTMDTDTGITRLLPPIPDADQENVEVKVNKRNVLVVLLNRSDKLMVGGAEMDRLDLKDKTIEFFTNPRHREDLPVMEDTEVQFPPGSSSLLPPNGMEGRGLKRGDFASKRPFNHLREISAGAERVGGSRELVEK